MASTRKTLLAIGLKGITPDLNASSSIAKWTPEQVGKAAQEEIDRLHQDGIDVTGMFFGAADENLVADVEKAYNSQHWDVVLIGGGMRMVPECAQKFQDIMNVIVGKGQVPPPKVVYPNAPVEMHAKTMKVLGL